MKITFILPGVARKPVGGYKVVYQYADFFSSLGHEVSIYHVKFLPHDFAVSSKEQAIYLTKQILFRNGFFKLWYKFQHQVKLYYYENSEKMQLPKSDVVIATSWDTANIVDALPNISGCKYYFIQHFENWDDEKNVIKTWKLPLNKIVIATWLKDLAVEFGEDAQLVKNFIDPNQFYIIDDWKKRGPVVSMLYSEYPIKGSQLGLEAIKRAHKVLPKLKAILFGTGPAPDLPDYIKYIHNPTIKALREDIYGKSSVYLFPSQSEGWGLTANEAMACGNLLIGTDNGGIRDYGIPNETALVSPVNDLETLTNNLLVGLNNKDLRIRLTEAGIKVVKELTIKNSGVQFLEILKRR